MPSDQLRVYAWRVKQLLAPSVSLRNMFPANVSRDFMLCQHIHIRMSTYLMQVKVILFTFVSPISSLAPPLCLRLHPFCLRLHPFCLRLDVSSFVNFHMVVSDNLFYASAGVAAACFNWASTDQFARCKQWLNRAGVTPWCSQVYVHRTR